MWMLEKFLACKDCGTRLEEYDPKKGGSRQAHIARVFTCPGCARAGDALDAAQKSAKPHGAGAIAGLKVKLVPKWLVDYEAKNRTEADRERMREREREVLELEKKGSADESRPIRAPGLGGSRRSPVIPGVKSLSDLPPEADSQSPDE